MDERWVWMQRHSWDTADAARAIGIPPDTAAQRLRALGFATHRGPGLRVAPCAECGDRREVADMTPQRLCPQCEGERLAASPLRAEREAWLRRNPQFRRRARAGEVIEAE